MESASKGLEKLTKAAIRAANLPYTILAALALLSVVARLILISK